MTKIFLSIVILMGLSLSATAAELSPGNLAGDYKVSASVGFQKVYLNFRVLDTSRFEIQRVYPSGRQDEVCSGTYAMNASLMWDMLMMASGKVFKGVFVCPSKPGKNVDFNIDFKNKTTDDLVQGTTVVVTSSLAPGYAINAFVKKQ